MKDFKNLILCDYRSERVDIHVRASLSCGSLTISGHDLGPLVEECWGDEDYEYWYKFDMENTERLIIAIHGEEDPDTALRREFSGEDGCSKLRSLCESKRIKYHFSSYV